MSEPTDLLAVLQRLQRHRRSVDAGDFIGMYQCRRCQVPFAWDQREPAPPTCDDCLVDEAIAAAEGRDDA